MDDIHTFYCSKEWLELARLLKYKSNGACECCNMVYPYSYLRAHHIEELTLENVSNPKIALNPKNIKILCHDCHNKIHRRLGRIKKNVFIVCGPPCAGKTTYVESVATRYDLVVDLDKIQNAISVIEPYDKPAATKKMLFDIRDMLYDKIAFRFGEWENAYVIACLPTKIEQEQLQQRLNGADIIYINTSKAICVNRALERSESNVIKENQIKYIERYFQSLE